MSYEGYYEYITKDGLYYCCDCNDDRPPAEKPYWFHSVDQTNGRIRGCPGTYAAKKREMEPTVKKLQDYYGKAYHIAEPRYMPIGKHWRLIE